MTPEDVRERLSIFGPEDDDDLSVETHPWTVIGDLRGSTPAGKDWIEDDTNHRADDLLSHKLPEVEPDSELSCFFAYAKTEADALAVIELLATNHSYRHSWS